MQKQKLHTNLLLFTLNLIVKSARFRQLNSVVLYPIVFLQIQLAT